MTFTSPAPGRRVSRVARWTRPAAALAALAVLAFPGVATAATEDEPDEVVSLSIAPDDRGIVSRTQPVRLTVTAANGGDQPLAAGDVSVQRGERRLVSASAVDDWLSDGAAPGAFEEIATADLGAAPAGDATQEAISVDPADAGTDALTPGVYPVRAVFEAGDERLRARTVIVVPRTSTAGGSVGVIVPITAGARAAGVIDAETLAELTGPDGDLRAQLDAVTATPAILAVDPAIPASIRALGRSAPADAVAWLDELLALPNDRFALQYGDADLAAQVGAGATSPLEVTSFAAYLDPADFTGVDGDEDTATADPSATPGAPVLPSLDELLDVGAARDAVYWPATGTAGVETVRALSAVADTEDRPVTIVPSSVVRGDAAARATVDDADVLVYDAELSALLEDASAAESEAERAALLAQVTARSTFTPASEPLLVTVDRAGGRSAAALRDAIAAAADLPGRADVGLSGLLAADPDAVALRSVAPDDARVDVLREFRDAQAGLARVATVLDDPELLLGSERATELHLIGNAWLDDAAGWAEAITAHRERIATWSEGVALVPSTPITLAGTNSSLVFTVRNDLPWPATVDLSAAPNDARLVVQDAAGVPLGAQQTTRVEVPVTALVGSGESSIDLQLRSPSGIELGDRQTVDVSVRADWESVAVVTLSILVTGLLVLGVVRTISRRRRRLLEV